MERHSVPQNIMDVEFKLFGSLTVRQFANLAICIVLAVIFYFFNIPVIVKWPIIIGLVLLGLGLALVKINGQTFGTWLGNFIASMFTSQRKIWKKSPKVPEILTRTYRPQISKEQLIAARKKELPPFLREDIKQSVDVADKEEEERLKKLENYIYNDKTPLGVGVENSSPTALTSPVVNPSTQNLAGDTNLSQEDTYSFKQSEEFTTVGKTITNQNTRPISSKLVHKNLAEKLGPLEEEIPEGSEGEEISTPSSTMTADQGKYSQVELTETNKILQDRIKELTDKAKESPNDSEIKTKLEEMQKQLEAMQSGNAFNGEKLISQKPNVISGVVADKENNLLSQVRVLIKDKRGYLVRSLITDKSGYFVTTTALPEGEYIIEFESDKYPFDQYKVTLDGSIKDIFKFSAK